MTVGDAKPQPAFGFLTVVESDSVGLTGGYLLLNLAGRPLEFHCTAPVRPNRAQQILFGPTLQPYLYGEQIGQTLLAKASQPPLVVWTDVAAAASVREFIAAPVGLVLGALDAPPGWQAFELSGNRLAVSEPNRSDRDAILERLGPQVSIDLCEPFGRIREAIDEAQKPGRVQAA